MVEVYPLHVETGVCMGVLCEGRQYELEMPGDGGNTERSTCGDYHHMW